MGRNISHQEFTFKSYTVTTLVLDGRFHFPLSYKLPPRLQKSSSFIQISHIQIHLFLKLELMSFWGKEKDMSSTINGSSWPIFSAWTFISSPAFTEKLCVLCTLMGCCGQHSRQGSKVVNRTVWGKDTRDRIKVLKMGPGDSRPLGSRALFLRTTSLLFSVLASIVVLR